MKLHSSCRVLRPAALLLALVAVAFPLRAQVLDQVVFGDLASEAAKSFAGTNVGSPQINPQTGASYRYTLAHTNGSSAVPPLAPAGTMTFTLTCDPVATNYITFKFWGSDDQSATFYVYTNGVRMGAYGKDVRELIWNEGAPGLPGKHYYITYLLPKSLTSGKTSLRLAIGAIGGQNPYGTVKENLLNTTSPGVYAAYMSTSPYFTPVGEVQGNGLTSQTPTPVNLNTAIANMKTAMDSAVGYVLPRQIYGTTWQTATNTGGVPPAVYGAPTEGVISTTATNTTQGWLDLIANSSSGGNSTALNLISLCAHAYKSSWSAYYNNPDMLDRITAALDFLCRKQGSNGGLSSNGGSSGWKGGPTRQSSGHSLEGFGDWAIGDAFLLLQTNLAAGGRLDVLIDDDNNPATTNIARRVAWANMFTNTGAYLRSSSGRGHAPNQDYAQQTAMWLINESVRILDPAKALTTNQAMVYLYQCIGLGTNLYGGSWVSPEGLALEPGGTGNGSYDGNYGVGACIGQINFLAQVSGDPQMLAFADKMIGAAANFEFPRQDSGGYPIMTREGFINARNNFWPADEHTLQDSFQNAYRTNKLSLRATQLGLVQGFFADEIPSYGSAHFVGNSANNWRDLDTIIAGYAAATNATNLPLLPMEDAAPDFAWSDEVAGSLAVKDGDTKFVMTLNYRRDFKDGTRDVAHQWTNNIAAVHRITPQYDQMATFAMVDSTSFGGRYTAQYGPYRVVLNLQTNTIYGVPSPAGWWVARDLISRCVVDMTDTNTILPRTSLVLKQEGPIVADLGVPYVTNLFRTSDANGADSYVQSGTSATVNNGAATTLDLKRNGTTTGNETRKAWLRFPVAFTTSQRAVAAELRLKLANVIPGGVPITYKVYGLREGNAGESWAEGGINWNNAPANGTNNPVGMDQPQTSYLGTFVTSSTNRAVGATIAFSSLALRDFLNQNTNGLATLMISAFTTNATVESFASKENGTFAAPELAVLTATNSSVASYTITKNTSTPPISFTAGGIDSSAPVFVTVTAANTNLVPNANCVVSGSGFFQSLVVTPATNQIGSTVITMAASDGTNVTTQTFTLNVISDAPLLKWVGDGSGNVWNTGVTANWVYATNGSPTVFHATDQVLFDDTGSRSPAVSLSGSIVPEVWTVNTTNTYTFAGSGKITGNTALTLNGSGTVLLNNTGSNDFTGGVVINAGTLRIGTNNTGGNLPSAGEVSNNGTLFFSRTDNVTVRNRIMGTGALTKSAAGTLTLASSNTYSGATLINGGKVVVGTNGALSSLSAVTLGDLTGPANLDLLTASTTVLGLSSGTSGSTQTNTVTIGAGQTLTVAGDLTLGMDASGTPILKATGAGTLACRNGLVQIGGALTGTFQNTAIFDLTGLGLFTTDASTFTIGDQGGNVGGSTGIATVLLASNNIVKANTLNITTAHGGLIQHLKLGRNSNILNVDNLYVGYGGGRGGGDLYFNTASGSLVLRNSSGGTSGTLAIGGNQSGSTTGADMIGTMDVTGHQADIAVGLLMIGDRAGGNSTSGGATGTLSFDAGTLTASTVRIGSRTGGTAVKTISGTLNIGGGVANLGSIVLATNSTGVGNISGTLNLTGGTVTMSGNLTKGGGAATTASVTLSGATLDMGGFSLGGATNIDSLSFLGGTLANVGQINNGVGGLTKTGSGTLLLRGVNTFGGGTFITAGTLGGDGRVTGAVTNLSTGILRPGLGGNDTTTLTISNTLGLAGQTVFVLNRTNAQNSSRIAGVTTLTRGGTLTVSNLGPTLQAGDTFVLITANSATGTFAATNLPTLGANLAWVSSTTQGLTLQVVSTAQNLTWVGDGVANTWQNGGPNNWVNDLSQPAAFTGIEQVRFTDAGSQSPAVNLVGTLTPSIWAVSNANSYTFAGSGTIAGPTALLKSGPGSVTLTTANTYSGGTTVSAGTLRVNNSVGSGTGSGAVIIQSGGVLAGSGIISGSVSIQSGAAISPGAALIGSLAISNNLTLAGNVIVGLNKSVSPSNGVTVVTGVLTNAGNGTVTVSNLGLPPLVLGDRFYLFNKPLPGGQTMVITPAPGPGLAWNNNLAVDGSITVIPATYVWNSANAGNWSDTTANGWNTGGGSDYPKQVGVATYFSNNIAGNRSIVLDVPDAKVGSIYLEDTASSYYGWRIAPDANQYKLTMQAVSGNVSITENTAGGLGANNARVTCTLTLSNNLDITVANASASGAQMLVGAIQGPGFTVTKFGAGSLSFENGNPGPNTFDTLVVAAGTAMGHLTSGGNTIAPVSLIISNAATFALTAGNQIADASAVTVDGTLDINNRTSGGYQTETIGTLSGTGLISCSNPAGSTNTLTVAGSGTTTFSGTMEDGTDANSANQFALVKAGSGTLLLRGVSTHTGGTIISGGTLGGDGELNSAVTNALGGTLQPGLGDGDTSTLFIREALALAGNTVFALNRTNGQPASRIAGITALTLGGTLTVTNVGPALQAGDSFALFDATSTTGSFAAMNLPALGAGLGWTNQIAVDGTIAVVPTVNPNPTNIIASVNGGMMTLQWPVDHTGWLLESNSVGLNYPGSWFPVADSTTTNVFSVPIDTAQPQVFYRLTY